MIKENKIINDKINVKMEKKKKGGGSRILKNASIYIKIQHGQVPVKNGIK